jgi:hypothetical protein
VQQALEIRHRDYHRDAGCRCDADGAKHCARRQREDSELICLGFRATQLSSSVDAAELRATDVLALHSHTGKRNNGVLAVRVIESPDEEHLVFPLPASAEVLSQPW